METMTFSTSIRAGGGSVIAVVGTYEAAELVLLEDQIAANSTVTEACDVDVSTIKAMYIYSDKAVTVTPFDGLSATADGPFALAAKGEMSWNTDRQEACPLTADLTSLHIHNASLTDAANVKIGFLVDPN